MNFFKRVIDFVRLYEEVDQQSVLLQNSLVDTKPMMSFYKWVDYIIYKKLNFSHNFYETS